ncbi:MULTISPECIES: DUF188 domain-containing protein [unclassified Treponema]|uniref:YaiI/YqxD family protein n=1 Tax=unclassified Treponema TaxID=2638727 RepID=UPI0020A257D7|nr:MULTISPECIES: DUF188 domain-containing protein [unclassified Treponema]UTC67585.1 DUF188 domain-containing protein [Treponema sp. OMZ 789]UTC70312.1 DUF188 domain-containing protein [Treponema sp. OMZ 790]UTC73027.1 DUF188 domain-containing protein [Treponema sp. OMZ 791]
MKIWVDADSCPVRIRQITVKAADRLSLRVIFAANREIPLPKSENVEMAVTENTEQAADVYITENAQKGDLAITRDIPLAKTLVDKGLYVINDRGTIFTKDNINTYLSARNFMYELQANGLAPEKTNSFGKKEIQKFSNLLDSILSKALKARSLGMEI